MVDSKSVSEKILKNSLENNKMSHAYLFQIDNSLEDNELIFSFIKEIICPNKKNKNCDDCTICKRIDEGNYPEIKVINPDGLWIKKEQLLELQSNFNKKAVESNYLIYIINEVEKMNISAANTILKFLEEPESGIIAILVTNNIHEMLETIVSRCQLINLKSSTIKNDYKEEIIDETLKFLSDLEIKKIKIYENINDFEIVKTSNREYVNNTFEIILLVYIDLLNFILKGKFELFPNKKDILSELLKLNKENIIYKKINLIMLIKEKLKYNVNVNMLLDKFIIEFSGGE